ncbi:hypothetical protein GQ607_002286, partial [Colletotrichum asianum]
ASWLRSSVVSVLFSLISERCPLDITLIILIFDLQVGWSLWLAAYLLPSCPWYYTVSRRRKTLFWFSLLSLACPGL